MDFLVVLLVIGIAIALAAWHYTRSTEMLKAWAQSKGLTLINSKRRFLRRGSFFWTTSKGQEVFYVTVRDAHGNRRSGYVRVGGWFVGMLSDNVEVRWDDDPRAPLFPEE